KIHPGPLEHVVQQQHDHVAANPITTPGERLQQFSHGGARVGAAIIQLYGVNPGGEVRVFAMGEPATASLRSGGESSRGLGRSLNEKFRPLNNPRVVESEVIRHEVEQQAQSVCVKFVAE